MFVRLDQVRLGPVSEHMHVAACEHGSSAGTALGVLHVTLLKPNLQRTTDRASTQRTKSYDAAHDSEAAEEQSVRGNAAAAGQAAEVAVVVVAAVVASSTYSGTHRSLGKLVQVWRCLELSDLAQLLTVVSGSIMAPTCP